MMNFKIIKQAEEHIKKIEKETSAEAANSLKRVLKNAINGDKCAEMIIIEMSASFEMEEYQKAFIRSIGVCGENHNEYQAKLEELKQLYWGKPLQFSKALDKLHGEYERDYRVARNNKEGFKKSKEELVKASKKFGKLCGEIGINLDEMYKPQECFEDLSPEYECHEPITRDEVIQREKKEAEHDLECMDRLLNTVRTNMYNDFGMGKMAVDVINDLAQRESQNVQQAKN